MKLPVVIIYMGEDAFANEIARRVAIQALTLRRNPLSKTAHTVEIKASKAIPPRSAFVVAEGIYGMGPERIASIGALVESLVGQTLAGEEALARSRAQLAIASAKAGKPGAA